MAKGQGWRSVREIKIEPLDDQSVKISVVNEELVYTTSEPMDRANWNESEGYGDYSFVISGIKANSVKVEGQADSSKISFETAGRPHRILLDISAQTTVYAILI